MQDCVIIEMLKLKFVSFWPVAKKTVPTRLPSVLNLQVLRHKCFYVRIFGGKKVRVATAGSQQSSATY